MDEIENNVYVKDAKYQYTAMWTNKDGVSENFTLRMDSWDELKTARDQALATRNVSPQSAVVSQPVASPVPQNVPVCSVHGTTKVLRPPGVNKTTGKPYDAFYACPTKNADGSYCKAK